MDRPSVEGLLQAYAEALEATQTPAAGSARYEYQAGSATARNLLARWRGGESEERLKAAVEIELVGYRANPPAGRQGELIGAAFGAVCRAVGAM
jgi:hypothetical protein